MILDKLKSIYARYGNKAVYPVIFFGFLILNFIGGMGMTYPATDPNELSVIAVAQYFAGRNWSGVMCSVDYYYGFLQGLIYTPAVLLFDQAEMQYAAMMFINALLISLVPVIAYSLAYRMKVEKFWKLMVIAVVAGGYCCYYAHSKFAWSETVSIIIPWLIVWLAFRCGYCKNRVSRFFLSLLLGALCALSLAAHTRLVAVCAAVLISLILIRIFYGKKLVNFFGLLFSFALTFLGVSAVTYILQSNLWCQKDPALLKNTFAEFIANFSTNFSNNGLQRIAQTFAGQFYYFVTSTWGIGAVSFCLFGAVIAACVRHRKNKEPHTYEIELVYFSIFAVLTIVFTIVFSTLYRFSSDSFYTYQDTVMFGRFLDGVIPFALIYVLVTLFTHSISINKILGAVAVLGVIYIAFFVTAMPTILECGATRISPVLALYPLRIGAESVELLTAESFFLTMSMTFCVMALAVVVISCTKKYRSVIISLFLTGLTVYSFVFISTVYLPICRSESVAKNEYVSELSENLFNNYGAPAVTALNISRHEALMLQFLNQNINVRVTYSIENVPENSFLAVHRGEDVSALENSRSPFLLVAECGNLRLYAYGERALAYLQSQNIDESELEAEKETLIPEKTTAAVSAPEETAPPVTTVPAPAPVFSELTPAVSTYTTPAVVTSAMEEIDDDFQWAVIE